jgi:Peptidase A4 family
MKKVALGEGISVITYAPPPQGFNPFEATDSDLEKHGYPPLPKDPRHLERYRQVLNQLKHKLTYVAPTFRLNRDRIHGPRRRETEAGTEQSGNWSGAVVYAPQGQSFKWIEGDWVVPDIDAPTQNQWYYCASWIGIDGDGSNDVFQAGIECEVYRSGNSISRNIYPWWEWFPNFEVQITNFNVNPGDYVLFLLCSKQGAGSSTGTVYITNRTTGVQTSVTLNAPGSTVLVGNSAEWIVEAPTVGGSQSAIADYGEVFFSVCEAVLSPSGTTVNGGAGNNVNMIANGQVVSDGKLITPTVVQCLYAGVLPAAAAA